MPRRELRHATFRLVDGYSNTAQADGDIFEGLTSADIKNMGDPGLIPVSSRFTGVGSAQIYTVTDQDGNAQFDIAIGTHDDGTFTVIINGQETAPLDHDVAVSAFQTALNNLSNVEPGDFLVSGTVGVSYTIKALPDGAYGNIPMPGISANLSSLTGGSGHSAIPTHAGGVTHNISFTPAVHADHEMDNNAALTFTGRTVEVKIGEGNWTHAENREYNYDLDRGNLDTVREGDQIPMDWTLDLTWEQLTAYPGVDTPTVEDAFKRKGPASDWENAADDPCEPYAVDIEIEFALPCGDVPIEVLTVPAARFETLDHDLDAATISASGRANVLEPVMSFRERIV